MTVRTTDGGSYYSRYGTRKKEFIRAFVLGHASEIRSIYDVGCNNGDMSAQFMRDGIDVLGADASDSLNLPDGYQFRSVDITADNTVRFRDCTFFLSLYHHILGAHGLETADRIFFQLLLRTKFLVFDTGNVTEKKRDDTEWYKKQASLFASEKELLDHFGLPCEVIGTWKVAGGTRSVCVFRRRDFDAAAKVVEEFRRQPGSRKAKKGLTPLGELREKDDYFDGVRFFRFRLSGRDFFAKKWLDKIQETVERENIEEAYGKIPAERLLTFYGVTPHFGLVYDWIERFTWKRKLKNETVHGFHLHDGDLIDVDGSEKIIDFWSARDPRGGPVADEPPGTGGPDDGVRLTVAVFTRRRSSSLKRCLRSMRGNASLAEVLVFNDDGTAPLDAQALRPHLGAAVQLRVFNPGDFGISGHAPSKPVYMNKAVELAANRHVLFCDDGRFSPGAIDCHARALNTYRFCAGSIVKSRLFVRPSTDLLRTTNCSFDADFYRAAGGYSERFAESVGGGDEEFWYRIHRLVRDTGAPVALLCHAVQRVRAARACSRGADPRAIIRSLHNTSENGPLRTWFPQVRDKKTWMSAVDG